MGKTEYTSSLLPKWDTPCAAAERHVHDGGLVDTFIQDSGRAEIACNTFAMRMLHRRFPEDAPAGAVDAHVGMAPAPAGVTAGVPERAKLARAGVIAAPFGVPAAPARVVGAPRGAGAGWRVRLLTPHLIQTGSGWPFLVSRSGARTASPVKNA